MKSVLYALIFFFLLIGSLRSNAQGENNNWCFGNNYGLNFNTSPPTLFTTNMSVLEGSASVSDANGNLLFYSSGAYIWDRNGNLMPNGQGLSGNGPMGGGNNQTYPLNIGSSAEGVCIIPSPSNPHQYYLIVTDAGEDAVYNAYYSVIDMTLNGGLGDVVATKRNIVLATNVAEGVKSLKGADCNSYWALLMVRTGDQALAFKIDASGISTTPVISNNVFGEMVEMAVNAANDKVVLPGTNFLINLCDFNKATGVITPIIPLQLNQSYETSAVFSPDDSKLYVTNMSELDQFDLSLYPNIAAIQNSQTVIYSSIFNDADYTLRLGPDGKIYGCPFGSFALDRIDNPNAAGALCQYVSNAIMLNGIINSFVELGNDVQVNHFDNPAITTQQNFICPGEPFTLTPSQNYLSYYWNTGDTTATLSVNALGKYWVQGVSDCVLHIDTFNVLPLELSAPLGPDTAICKDGTLLLNPNAGSNATYLWQDGSNNPTFSATANNTYYVHISQGSCTVTDSIHIGSITPSLRIAEPDTSICKGSSILLHAIAQPKESSFVWNTGSATDTTTVNSDGVYYVKASNACGTFYDSVKIESIYCYCDAFMPTAFSPNGDGLNDVLMAHMNCPGLRNFVMHVYNRFGQEVYQGWNIETGWDGTYNGKPADVGTYFYYLQYKNDGGDLISKKGDVVLLR